jgi:hypothetical protein
MAGRAAIAVLLFFMLLPVWIVLIIMSIFFAPLRMLLPFAMMRGRGPGGSGPQTVEVPVSPFTVTTEAGQAVEVMLRGEIYGGALHLGDRVQVSGRTSRTGVIKAKQVTNLDTGSQTRVRTHPVIRNARLKMVGSAVLVVFALLVALNLLHSCGIV